MLLTVPLMNTCVAMFSHIARGMSPLTGGEDYLSDRLVRGGLSRRVAEVSLWSATEVCALMAVGLYSYPDSINLLIIGTFAVLCLGALVMFSLTRSKD